MTELLDRKGNPLEEKVSISLPQKDIAETVVEVKEVYNKDFTENFAKITSENYKETNKQENSELFFKWSHGFKDAFVLEEKELLKTGSNHKPERTTINKKLRAVLPLKKKDADGKLLPIKSFENKFSRASMLGEMLYLGTAEIQIEKVKNKSVMTARMRDITPIITTKEGVELEVAKLPQYKDSRVNISFEEMERTHREQVRGIIKSNGQGGSTISSPVEKYIDFMTKHTESDTLMESLAKKIAGTRWDTKTYNVNGMIESGEFTDLQADFDGKLKKAMHKIQQDLEKEELEAVNG
jgi:hypothetical protein